MALLTVFMILCLITLSSSRRVCPTKWYKIGSRCFKFINIRLPWTNAEKACQAYDANLASVHSSKESYLLDSLIGRLSSDTVEVWIGGYTISREFWLWSDGSEMIFQKWARGEPNNARGNENCIIMHTGGKNNWNDHVCSTQLKFVCAKNSVKKTVQWQIHLLNPVVNISCN